MTWTLHLGDCLEYLRTLPDGSVDAVVTDPPYGMSYQSNHRNTLDRFDVLDGDDQPCIWFLKDAARVLRDGGALLCFCRWDTAEAFRLAIGWAGLQIVSQLIWDREVHGVGDLKGCPGPRHDTVWMATKGRFEFPGKRPTSILRHMRVSGDNLEHPTEKPVSLMLEMVADYTRPDDVVFDPFAGSGTTGVAAIRMGRNFIGCEISPEYHAIATRRLKEAEDADGLFTKETT